MAAIPARAAVPMAIDPRLMQRAMASFGAHRAQVRKADIIAIADYSQKSRDRRFHIVDMVSGVSTSMVMR